MLVISSVVALALGLSAGAAYGYFTSHGSGTGAASDGTMQVVTVAAITSETPNTPLLPGSTGEVIVKVDNPNAFQVHLVSVVPDGTISVTGGSGCTLANSGVSFTSQTLLSIPIPASMTTLVRLPGAASMTSASVSGCQGATFNVPVTITVHTP
jgi:hypothetical protein